MRKIRNIQITGVILLIAVQALLGQPGGLAIPYNRATHVLVRASKVNATEEQSEQLKDWMESTAAFYRKVGDLEKPAKSNIDVTFSGEFESFRKMSAADNLGYQGFLAGLSESQRSGLKGSLRKLDRANLALAKALTEITESSGQALDRRLLAKGIHRAKQAILAERHEQKRLAHEMGVPV